MIFYNIQLKHHLFSDAEFKIYNNNKIILLLLYYYYICKSFIIFIIHNEVSKKVSR